MPNTEHRTTEGEMKDIWERLTAAEASTKSAHKRIDAVENMQKSINSIAVSVGEIATETRALRSDFNKVEKNINDNKINVEKKITEANDKIAEIEQRPIKRYDTVVTAIITTLTGGIVGFLLNALL